MRDIGILARRMNDYANKVLNKINSTSKLFYARIPDNDVVLLMGDNREMQTDFTKGDTFDIQRHTLMQILPLKSSQKKLRLSLQPLLH